MTFDKTVTVFVFCFLFISVFSEETKIEFSKFDPILHNNLKDKMILALAAHCEPNVLKPWNCFWCKQTKSVKYITHFDFKDSLAFGYIGETDSNSKKILKF